MNEFPRWRWRLLCNSSQVILDPQHFPSVHLTWNRAVLQLHHYVSRQLEDPNWCIIADREYLEVCTSDVMATLAWKSSWKSDRVNFWFRIIVQLQHIMVVTYPLFLLVSLGPGLTSIRSKEAHYVREPSSLMGLVQVSIDSWSKSFKALQNALATIF